MMGRRVFRGFIAALVILCLLLVPVGAFALNYSVYYLSGYAERPEAGLMVSLDVCEYGKSLADADITDYIYYHQQSNTGENGKFEFKIPLKEQDERYTAYVYCEGDENIREYTIYGDTVLNSIDFDGNTAWQTPWSDCAGSASLEYIDSYYKESMKFEPSASVSAIKKFNDDISSGIFKLSMDIQVNSDAQMNVSLINNRAVTWNNPAMVDSVFNLFVIEYNRFKLCQNTKGYLYQYITPAEQNCWYTIDVILDFDERTAFYYIDGEFWGMTDLNISLDKICGFMLYMPNKADLEGGIYVDNIRAALCNRQNLPQEVSANVSAKCGAEALGNIFTDVNGPCFDINFKTRYGRDTDITAVYVVCDENGREICREEKLLSVSASEGLNDIYKPKKYVFGKNVFKVLIFESGNEIYRTDMRFSVVRTAADGAKNSKAGINLHAERYGNTDYIIPLMDYTGARYIRDHVPGWSNVETKSGEYEIPDFYKHYLDTLDEYSMKHYMLDFANNPMYCTPSSGPPNDEDGYEAWYNYCYNFVVESEGKVPYFEVMNEYHSSKYNYGNGPEVYARVMTEAYSAVEKARAETGYDIKVVGIVEDYYAWNHDGNWIKKYLEVLNGEKAFDVVSLHPYPINYDGAAPENCGMVEFITDVRELLEQYGYGDTPIIISEVGWEATETWITDEKNQANYYVRTMGLNDIYELSDLVIWYEGQDWYPNTDGQFKNFGMLKSYYSNEEIPYEAREAFAACCNYNAIMANAKLLSYEITDDKSYVLKYRTRDGNITYVAWNSEGDGNTSIQLSGYSAVKTDIFGNSSIVSAPDGEIELQTTERPVYITDSGCIFSYEINEDNIMITAKYKTSDYDVYSVKPILALYRNSMLSEVVTEFAETFDGEYTVLTAYADIAEVNRIKAVAFESLNTLKPISSCIEIEI